MRPRLLPLCLLLSALFVGVDAYADEVFVLDNGFVVRGRVVREDDKEIVVKLKGFAKANTITLTPSEIVRRFDDAPARGHRDKGVERLPLDAAVPDGVPEPKAWTGAPKTTLIAPDLQPVPTTTGDVHVPGGDPGMKQETFFARLERVSRQALPQSLEGLLLVGFLLLVVLTIMVAGGTRLLGMKAPSLHASTTLGLMLGVFLVADIRFSDEMLRADRAVWIVPLQVGLWLTVARSTLDAPIARIIPLFSMVLFAATCFMFATGSLLISL